MKPISLGIAEWSKQKLLLFAIYSIFSVLFLYVINDIIITDPQAFTGGNESSIEVFRNVYKVIYLLNPIYSILKIVVIALGIQKIIHIINDTEIEFSSVFTIVLLAEYILLLPDFIQIIWFLLIHTNYTMEEVQAFFPFSLYSLFNPDSVSRASDYILKLINPFEIAYWAMLAFGIKEITGTSIKSNLKAIASSYGIMLLAVIIIRYIIFGTILNE